MKRLKDKRIKQLRTFQNSQPPNNLSDLRRHKNQLQECLDENCSGEELADAYEAVGLSLVFLGNYVEAASNLEHACGARETVTSHVDDKQRSSRLKFWVGFRAL